MDLNNKICFKLIKVSYSNVNFKEYRRIVDALGSLCDKYNHKISEMWCSHIHDLFRKILEENYSKGILSKNKYIIMYKKLYESNNKVYNFLINYIQYIIVYIIS